MPTLQPHSHNIKEMLKKNKNKSAITPLALPE
jgi:hypothetical protein